MAIRQRCWAREQREILRQLLGDECARCHKRGTVKNPLQFDCIESRGDYHHRQEWSARMCFYRAQFKSANLQLLCARCHGLKSSDERYGR